MLWITVGGEKNNIDSNLQKVNAFSWNADLVRSLIDSNSLFGGNNDGIIFENISENEEAHGILKEFAEKMTGSKKKFFVFENEMDETEIEFWESEGAKINDLRKDRKPSFGRKYNYDSDKNDKFNPFALGDALGRGKAKDVWVEYQRSRFYGAEPEEIHSRLWSKVRDMIASENATAAELGIHPFVHKKARADLRNWTKVVLCKFSDDLLDAYHSGRMAHGESLDATLEKILLNI